MTGLVYRLKERMKAIGVKPGPLADMAGVGHTFVYDIIYGRSSDPSYETLSKVAAILQTTAECLLKGDAAGRAPADLKHDSELVSIPFLAARPSRTGAMVGAGDDQERHYFQRAWISDSLKARPGDLRLWHVPGDSMAPTLLDGDLVIIDQRRTSPSPPGMFVIHDGHTLVAKRLEPVPGTKSARVRLISDNERYPPHDVEAVQLRVIGRVVWFARQL
jgi:phage repressor protein C with HTH and peptisase S24 domain